jgi:hypothetical protein
MTDMIGGSLWFVVLTVGPLLLLAAMIWQWRRNRKASPRTDARSERGARELREEIRRDPDYSED